MSISNRLHFTNSNKIPYLFQKKSSCGLKAVCGRNSKESRRTLVHNNHHLLAKWLWQFDCHEPGLVMKMRKCSWNVRPEKTEKDVVHTRSVPTHQTWCQLENNRFIVHAFPVDKSLVEDLRAQINSFAIRRFATKWSFTNGRKLVP